LSLEHCKKKTIRSKINVCHAPLEELPTLPQNPKSFSERGDPERTERKGDSEEERGGRPSLFTTDLRPRAPQKENARLARGQTIHRTENSCTN
jgi:hypothetical protein